LRGRFHDHFLNVLGDQPVRQSAQFTWTGSHFPPLKLVLALHGYVRDNHGQHSLVHIDPGNSVCHLRLLPENRAHAKNEIIQGLRLLRRRRNYSAHLFAQQRMRRTSQLVGLDFSTGRSISLLPVMASVAKARLIFMTFRELRLTRRLNWRNAFSYLRVREAILASLGIW